MTRGKRQRVHDEATPEERVDAPASEAARGPEDDPQPAPPAGGPAPDDAGHGTGLLEPPEEAVRRLSGELAELKDRYLRAVADYDNLRKRTARERTEMWERAQAELAGRLIDGLDDLARVAALDPQTATAGDVIAGVELVERKLVRELESAGLHRVGAEGAPFDPHEHEAVGTVPAASPEQDHTVAEVLQIGYRFGGALLRPARVRVYVAAAEGAQD